MNPCHYSLLQLRPDVSREEGLNVGIVVVRAPGEVVVRVVERGELVEVLARLGAPLGDIARSERTLTAFANRLRRLRDASASGLREFAACEAGEIELLPPHAVASGDPVAVADRLFSRLVRPRSPNVEPSRLESTLLGVSATNAMPSARAYGLGRSMNLNNKPDLMALPPMSIAKDLGHASS
jgi:hypothetical protein